MHEDKPVVHLPECPLSDPCANEDGHDIIVRIAGLRLGREMCCACMADCACERIRRVEARMARECETHRATTALMIESEYLPIPFTDYQVGYCAGLRKAVGIVKSRITPAAKDT